MSNTKLAPRLAAEVTEWSDEADVVIVGFGAAGTSAAYEAATIGADVLILDRAGAAGGASALSDGLIYLGGGTPTQIEAGFADDVESMKTFLNALCGPSPDQAKIDVYCEQSLEHHGWLVARGVQFLGAIMPQANGASPRDGEGLMYTGGENAYPFDELTTPAPRAHATQGGRPGGAELMKALTRSALAAGARTSFDTRVERLIIDEAGRVCGVIASQYGDERAIRARSGVVLAAGGFAFNDEMATQYAPLLHRTSIKIGTDGDDGRGIQMAQAVGAQVKRMDSIECALPFNAPRALVKGILVNRLGQRFVNEDTYMGRVGQRALVYQDAQVYLIIDEANYTPNWLGVTAVSVCETADELGSELGLPAGSLETTLGYYNRYAADGEDPQFHKRAPAVVPLTGALAAFDLNPETFPYAVFTLGGLHTRVDGSVLDLDGVPIPGLFAAGRTTSGIAALGYASGLSLGDSTFFGRRAGLAAAAACPDERTAP